LLNYESEENRPIIIKSSRRHSLLYTSCCIFAGMIFSLAVLSLTASVKIAALRPVSLYPGWELDAPLQPGEDLVENGGTCGTSPQEARDRGCKSDLVLYSWVPAPCYDEEIQIAYRKRESEWYRNRGGVGGEKIP
jgi:hypothetical protein